MNAAESFLSSSVSLHSRCEEVLRDITETQQGTGKAWKNVQPCVLHASQLLLLAAQRRDERLARLEEQMRQVLAAIEVLASDSRLKERRYRLDREETSQALRELRRGGEELREAVRAERHAAHRFHEEVLFPGLADIQEQIDCVAAASRAGLHAPPPPLQQPSTPASTATHPTHSSYSPPAPSSPALSPPPPPLPDPAVRDMVREVKLLRSQWQKILEQSQLTASSPSSPLRRVSGQQRPSRNKDGAASTAIKNAKVLLSMVRPSVDCSVARWQWRGGYISPPTLSPDTPIPWSTLHVRKTTTGEWLSAGATSDGALIHSELTDGVRPPFIWLPQRPSVIELMKGGIYCVTVCLLTSCNSCTGGKSQGNGQHVAISAPPSMSLRVNDKTVFTFTGGSTCYTLHTGKGTSRRISPSRPPASHRTSAQCQECTNSRRSCSCGASTTCTSSSFSDFLRLPAGSLVSVHCHHASDTTATHEALMEVELVAE